MKKYFFFAATALALAACSNNEDENLGNGPVEVRITAGVSTPETRANGSDWEQDAIGVMVTNAPTSDMANLYKNVKYTTTANNTSVATFTPEGEGIFFQDASETVTFAAYAPYQTSAANDLPGAKGVIAGSTENQPDREKQKTFDYIYASEVTASRTDHTVEFKFAHKMTRLIIVVKTSADYGFTASDVTSGKYSLSGLKHSGEFNVTTGKAEATGTITNDWSLNNSLKNAGDEQVTFTSILYPQDLTGNLTFKAEIDGQTYTNNTIKPDLAAGKSYTVTITAKKTGLEIKGCTVSGWGEENKNEGDAMM